MSGEGTESEMIQENNRRIHDDILPRLKSVEDSQRDIFNSQEDMKKEMASVKHGQTEVQSTLMKEGQNTRDMLSMVLQHAFDYKKQQDNNDHAMEMKRMDNQGQVKVKQLDTREKIIVGVLGGGSAAGLIMAVINIVEKII